MSGGLCSSMDRTNELVNELISQNPRRVAHYRVSSLVIVCRRSFAAKANLFAIETALLTRRQQSADLKVKVCQVGVTMNTSRELSVSLDRLFSRCLRNFRPVLQLSWSL